MTSAELHVEHVTDSLMVHPDVLQQARDNLVDPAQSRDRHHATIGLPHKQPLPVLQTPTGASSDGADELYQ